MKTKINLLIFWTLTSLAPLTTNMNSKCTTKKAITSIHIKATSCIDGRTVTSSKVHSKVSFTEHTQYVRRNLSKKIKILIDMFVENGHNKQLLKNLVIKYNNKKNNKNNVENNTENRD